jgi:copper oxidase (laccase) domain-containing protein
VIDESYHIMGKGKQEADALFSAHGKPLGVYVADCVPLVLVAERTHAIIHCSWKTLF